MCGFVFFVLVKCASMYNIIEIVMYNIYTYIVSLE